MSKLVGGDVDYGVSKFNLSAANREQVSGKSALSATFDRAGA